MFRVKVIIGVWLLLGLMIAATAAQQTPRPTVGRVFSAQDFRRTLTGHEAVAAVMAQVADWQLAHPSEHGTTDWTHGALFAGLTAWARMAEDAKYMDALKRFGAGNQWQLGRRRYHADDHCVGQMYLALYKQYRDPVMIRALKERFDWILANPSDSSLDHDERSREDRWWWCDALFMGPPVWAELAAVTGEKRYLDFMNREWWATTDFLYDEEEHLYFRDSRFFDQREANGKKIFWSRGNGWVFAGLVKVLQALPTDYPDRPRYIALYKEMAAKLVEIQGDDGLWRSSLLDPATYPPPEASGSGFYCYGLAWGVNRGILPQDTYEPAVRLAWDGLVNCVHDDGKLGWIQPIGGEPGRVNADLTEIYGVGAFLLAGSEVYKMALKQDAHVLRVHANNPITVFRNSETLSLPWSGLTERLKDVDPRTISVFDFSNNRVLVTQLLDLDADGTPEELLFQSDFAPNEQKWFWVLTSDPIEAPAGEVTTFGRFVPERMDDFAWENDRIAFRMYGKALEAETVSSGVDVWVKKVTYPVINKWYAGGDYHEDHGEGLDYYHVGPTRGCGGLAVYEDGRLLGSRNFVRSRVLANGPIRTVFELDYEPWEANGIQVSETKRISLDLGSNVNRFESRFQTDEPLQIAVGIVLRGQEGAFEYRPEYDVLGYWEPPDPNYGIVGCGVVMPGDVEMTDDDEHILLHTQIEPDQSLVYYAGACWSQSGQFANREAWMQYLVDIAKRVTHPVKINIQTQGDG